MGPMEGTRWGYGSDIHPCVSDTSLKPYRLVWAYDYDFLDTWNLQIVLFEALTCLRLPTRPHSPLHPSLICAICDFIAVVKKLLKIQQC